MVGAASSSDVLLDALFRSVATGLCLLSPGGRIARVNAVWSRAMGLPDDGALVGRSLGDLSPDLLTLAMAAKGAPLGTAVSLAARLPDLGWDESVTPVPWSDGEVGLLLSAAAKPPLETTREPTYRAVFRNVRDAVGLVRPVRDAAGAIENWKFLDLNEVMAKLLRRPVEDIIGRCLTEVAPGRLEIVREGFARVLSTGEAWRYEVAVGAFHQLVTVFRVDHETLGSAAVDVSDLKVAESSLRRSEMQLRQLVEHTPVGIALLDRDMRYLAVSRRFTKDYGVEATALIGHCHYDVFPGIPERWRQVHARCLAGAAECADEDVFPHADGRKDWVSWDMRPWHESDGKIGGLVLFSQVITERKSAADKLEAAKERLAVTLASIGDAVVATDEQGRITVVNPVAAALTGWPIAEAVGRPLESVFEIVNEEGGVSAESPTARVLREGVVVGLANHTILVSRDGARRPIADSAAPIRDATGAIRGVVLVFRDQTEERKAEAALLRSRLEFKTLVEKLPIGVFVADASGILYANPVFADYLGCAQVGALVGRLPQDLTAPGTSPTLPLAWKEWTVCGADGKPVALECASVREVDFEGRRAFLYACRDLRELKQMQARVIQNDRMATLGMLAAGVAHEINNPLTYVISSLDLIEERLNPAHELGAEQRAELVSFSADAVHGARRVQAIVRDLRSFSRPEKDDAKLLDLAKVLDAAIGMVANQIGHKARLVRDYGRAPAVVASEARLGQVFINLLVNASQAIAEGQREKNEIRVVLGTDEHGRAVVEVRDTGAGIAPEVMERIFDPFFTTKGAGGTGLGLSISRNTLAGLGGDIRLESTLGQGTLARMVLPPGAPPRAATGPSGKVIVGPRRAKVLVVDDEQRICWTLQRALQSDHDVVAETRAEAASERLARGERYDVIFCDIMMPGMTGIELFQSARRTAPEQAERFVFITGGTFTQGAEDFLEGVPNRRLAKPFDLQELRALVNRAVP